LNNNENKPTQLPTLDGDSILGISSNKPAAAFSFNLPKTTSQSTLFGDKPSVVTTASQPESLSSTKSNNSISSQPAQVTKSTTEQQTSIFGSNSQKSIFGASSAPSFGGFGQSSSLVSTNNSNPAFSFTFGNSPKPNEPSLPKPQEESTETVVTTTNEQKKVIPTETSIFTSAPSIKTTASNDNLTISKTTETVSTKSELKLTQDLPVETVSAQTNNIQTTSAKSTTEEAPKTLRGILADNSSANLFGNKTTSTENVAGKGFSFNLNTQNSAKVSLFGTDSQQQSATLNDIKPLTATVQTTAAPTTITKPVTNEITAPVTTPSVTPSTSIFNLSQPSQPQLSTQQPSLFGAAQQTATTGSSLFSMKPSTVPTEETKQTAFGFTQQAQQNSFLNMKPVETPAGAGGSLFSNFGKSLPATTTNPFGAQNQGPSDVSMEANNQNEVPNLFGGLGFSNTKPVTNENKNPFGTINTNNSTGGSLFGGLMANNSQKPAFGSSTQGNSPTGGIIKGPTFTFNNQNSFGQSSTPFGAPTTQTQPTGNLFSSFTTSPPKTGFGAAPTFGAAPAFGASPSFGSTGFGGSTFGAAPTFGSVTSPTGFGSTSQAPLFGSGSFTSSSSTSTNLFGGGGGVGGGSTNNSTGLSFGQLAQQQQPQAPQQQQNLFSNFTTNQPAPTFGSPNNR